MTPQPCIAPPEEVGDCWRACIASILNLSSSEVPNFADCGDMSVMLEKTREWLKPRGLALFQTYCSGHWTVEKVLAWFSAKSPDAPFILCGASRRDPASDHAVVAMGGSIAHDPSGSGLSGPMQGDEGDRWWFMHVICLAGSNVARQP